MENHLQNYATAVQGARDVTFKNCSLTVQAGDSSAAASENRKRKIPGENEEAKKLRNADHYQLSEFIWIFQDKPLGKRKNVFEGEMRSDVCNPRRAAIKYIQYNEKNVKEAKILEKLTPHPHVVAILHSNTVPGPMNYLYIAMERCHTQNLQDFIIDRKKQGVPFDFSLVLKYTEQLIDGMRHIHKNKIIHRDLKPENILFSYDMQSIKISDFGLSKEMKSGRSVTNQSTLRVGTDGFRAPETYNENVISLKADIFSLALVLFYLWSYGLHPFGNDPDLWNYNIKNNQKRDLKTLVIPQIPAALGLLERMLKFEPSLRPTIEEVFQDPCVSELTVIITRGIPDQNRMTPQSVASNLAESSAIGTSTNMPNTNPVMRPMNQMPVQQSRGLTNSNMQVRRSIQMQPGVNTQPRMGFSSPPQTMSENGQMSPQSMSSRIQQQSNMGAQMQQRGVWYQQYMYQNNMHPRQMAPSRPAMNPSNPDMSEVDSSLKLIAEIISADKRVLPFARLRPEKEWHNDVKEELRKHWITKMIHFILSQPQNISSADERMKEVINFARKVEGDIFNQANSRSEYYHLIAEKLYKIHQELEENRAAWQKIASEETGKPEQVGQQASTGNSRPQLQRKCKHR